MTVFCLIIIILENCTKFGQLIINKIFRLKYTKFDLTFAKKLSKIQPMIQRDQEPAYCQWRHLLRVVFAIELDK